MLPDEKLLLIAMVIPLLAIGLVSYLAHFLWTGQKIPSRKTISFANFLVFIQQIFIFINVISFYISPWTESSPTDQITQAFIYSILHVLIGCLFEMNLEIVSIFSVIFFPDLKKSTLKRVSYGIWIFVSLVVTYQWLVALLYFVWQVESPGAVNVNASTWKTAKFAADCLLFPSAISVISCNFLQDLAICRTIMAWKRNSSSPKVIKIYNQILTWIYIELINAIIFVGIGLFVTALNVGAEPESFLVLALSAGFFPSITLVQKTKEFVNIKKLTFEGIKLKNKTVQKDPVAVQIHDTMPATTLPSDTIRIEKI